MSNVKEFLSENPLRPFYAARGAVHNYHALRGKIDGNRFKESLFVTWESAADLIEFVDGIDRDLIGDDHSKVCNKHFQSRDAEREWRFGSELKNYSATDYALRNGIATDEQRGYFESYRRSILAARPDLADLEMTAVVKKRRKVFSETGDELDIDRYMNGEVEQWTKKSTTSVRKRTAKIWLAMPTSSGNDPKNFSKAVAFVIALSDIIELAGISTEIAVSFNISDQSPLEDLTSFSIIGKRVEESLDIERLLSLGHVGLYRNFIFAAQSHLTASESHRATSSTKGHCLYSGVVKELIAPAIDADVVVYADDIFVNRFETSAAFDIIIKQITTTIGIE